MNPLISVPEAAALIQHALPPPRSEAVPLEHAIGRLLVAPLHADRDLPPYPRAMMDGIAFAAGGLPPDHRYTLAGLHAAGDPPPSRPLAAGEAWEIMTGACVPDDCDTVVPYEHLAEGRIAEALTPGQFIHPAGSDARAGQPLLAPGALIGPVEIAIAASIGHSTLEVTALPRIAILSTGDEAVPIDTTPEPWQIRRSNGAMLHALLRHHRFPVPFIDHAPDDPARCGALIDQALSEAEVIILCGGISMGKKDPIRPLLEARLGPPVFHGVRQRPGKPLAVWSGPPLVFALPGNPVSVLATFTRYVLPALHQLSGQPVTPAWVELLGATPHPQLTQLLTVTRASDGSLRPHPPKNSGDFTSIAGACGIVEIAPGPLPGPLFPYYPFL